MKTAEILAIACSRNGECAPVDGMSVRRNEFFLCPDYWLTKAVVSNLMLCGERSDFWALTTNTQSWINSPLLLMMFVNLHSVTVYYNYNTVTTTTTTPQPQPPGADINVFCNSWNSCLSLMCARTHTKACMSFIHPHPTPHSLMRWGSKSLPDQHMQTEGRSLVGWRRRRDPPLPRT